VSWLKRLFPGDEPAGGEAPAVPNEGQAGAGPTPPIPPPVSEAPPEAATARDAVLRLEDVMRVQAVTASLLTRKVTPKELFRHIVDGAADCLNADEASLMLVDGDELRVVSARKAGEHVTLRIGRTKLGDGVAGWVAKEGKPLLLNEGDDFSRFSNFTPKGGRIRSSVSVPLLVEGRVVGVLNVNRLAGAEKFIPEDLAVLRLFADTAALAIDQTNLLQTVQTRARSLQALLSVTDAFSTERELDAALARMLPGLGETFHPSLVLAFLGSVEDGRLSAIAEWTPRHGLGGPEVLAGIQLAPTPQVAAAFEGRQPSWLTEPPLEGNMARHSLLPSRLLLLPVGNPQAQSRCAFLLGWEDPFFSLPSEDLNVLEGLTRQLALALSSQDRAAAVGALQAEMAQARAHLMEAERLATVGQSMAGVVHDINAPLTAVTAFAQLIQKDSQEEKSRERAGHIVEAATRAQRLVRDLLKMARPSPPTFELVDLHQLLRVAMDLERPQCSVSGIKLTAAFDPALPQVKADPHRLGQVFINLLVNARQAMDSGEKGSTLTVQSRRLDRNVELRFVDDGPGIPPAIKPKIFDWFFTTKPPGEGTGLGLAVSREILLAHGGNLRIEDSPGGGATFVLELPIPDA
jgi:signal transduction histidine kinase/GAF domain-containing protein